jgi:hypothetical protein
MDVDMRRRSSSRQRARRLPLWAIDAQDLKARWASY